MTIPKIMGIGAGESQGGIAAINGARGDIVKMLKTDSAHMNREGSAVEELSPGGTSFQNALIKAMDGVNAAQMNSTEIAQRMVTDPDSVDAHQVTIAQAEANMSLNIARVILDRAVRGWKEVINAR